MAWTTAPMLSSPGAVARPSPLLKTSLTGLMISWNIPSGDWPRFCSHLSWWLAIKFSRLISRLSQRSSDQVHFLRNVAGYLWSSSGSTSRLQRFPRLVE